MMAIRKSDPAGRLLLEPCCLNRRFFLVLAGVAGLSLAAPGIFGRAAASKAPATPPLDAAAPDPDVTRTATFAMG